MDVAAPIEDVNTNESEAVSNNIDVLDRMSSGGDLMRELESAGEFLTRIELDLACSSEKIVNLNILTILVATRETDYEAFVSEKEHDLGDSTKKALEFDFLSGILDSEVRELEDFMCTLQTEIINARGIVSSYEFLGGALKEMEEKLLDSEESLKQSLDQVSEIKSQSQNFQRILSSYRGEENLKDNKDKEFAENNDFSDLNAKIKMQTAEQQRHILRMLEKSLARELELEKKVAESRHLEEDLEVRLHSLEQEIYYMEEEAAGTWERFLEADNTAEVLMGISKELLGRLQIIQFNLNGSIQREESLSSELQDYNHQLQTKDSALQKLKEEIYEIAGTEDLKEIFSEATSRAECAEAKCEILKKTNLELHEELNLLKSNSERVDLIERKLRNSDIQLQHAVASAEASQEKQSMLYSTIKDMENLIEDLKSKVSKAEIRAESAEDKLIILSESNADLTEELRFLRGRIESLEASLREAEETKKTTAKDISAKTKLITDLIMQLALERERLQKQMFSLSKENRILVKRLGKIRRDPTMPDCTDAACNKDGKEAVGFSAASFGKDERPKKLSVAETEMGRADSASKLETVRNIAARQLDFKYIIVAVLMLVMAAFAALLLQQPNGQF